MQSEVFFGKEKVLELKMSFVGFLKLVTTVLYMARSVQISDKFSVKHEPNFLISLLPFFQ
jgi:hypothetical protein